MDFNALVVLIQTIYIMLPVELVLVALLVKFTVVKRETV
jgi:hypothetical protein